LYNVPATAGRQSIKYQVGISIWTRILFSSCLPAVGRLLACLSADRILAT